jgi:hypothetical protein
MVEFGLYSLAPRAVRREPEGCQIFMLPFSSWYVITVVKNDDEYRVAFVQSRE